MRQIKWPLVFILLLLICSPIIAQSWNSGTDMGLLTIDWVLQGNEYTFTLTNPGGQNPDYNVLGWSLEPFNLPAPVEVVCPQGWEWVNDGGWKKFAISSNNQKYVAGGPALEPGENLSFTYKIGTDTTPVNSGEPGGSNPAFLTHVAAVSGENKGKWVAYTPAGQSPTWGDQARVNNLNVQQTAVPEPNCGLILIFNFFGLACLKLKQARV